MLSYILQTAERNCFLREEEGREDADSFVPTKKNVLALPLVSRILHPVCKKCKKNIAQPAMQANLCNFCLEKLSNQKCKGIAELLFFCETFVQNLWQINDFFICLLRGILRKKPLELWEQNCRITIALHFWKEKDEVGKLQFYLRKNRQTKVRSFATKNYPALLRCIFDWVCLKVVCNPEKIPTITWRI